MGSLTEEKFDEFEALWTLTNPCPSRNEGKDAVALWSTRIVLVGAMGLSGTRTGSIIGETEQLARFMILLGASEEYAWIFTGMEAILGFATIEATLFASGYLVGDKIPFLKNATTNHWYGAFMLAGIVPALVSNLGPAFYLLGSNIYSLWLVIVTVIVGLATFVLALIGGRILGIIEKETKSRFIQRMEDWEDRRQSAWYRSAQYKLLRSSLSGSVGIPSLQKEKPEEVLYNTLNGDTTIPSLQKEIGWPQRDIMRHLQTLQKAGKVKVTGMNIVKL